MTAGAVTRRLSFQPTHDPLRGLHPAEGLVEGVDGRQGFVEPGDGFREQVSAHHATTLVGGNHCISGNGAVVGASSR